jgi:hypothetical protein
MRCRQLIGFTTTLLRYRGAAMAEFWRALRTLKALQAEQAGETGPALAAHRPETDPMTLAPRPPLVHRPQPDEPERAATPRLDYLPSEPPAPARTLHEAIAPWMPRRPDTQPTPNEPEPARARQAPATPASRTNPKPAPEATGPAAARAGRAPDRRDRMDAAGPLT